MRAFNAKPENRQARLQWQKTDAGQQAVAEAKARYRQTPEGKVRERAFKDQYRDRENELARVRAKQPHNLAKNASRQKQRREALARAHPSHRAEIAEIYEMAASLGMTVDHIVSLYSETVWGLHAPQNLQILTIEENSRKGTKIDVDGDSHG